MKKKLYLPKARTGLVVLARQRNGGPMKDRRTKRVTRQTWRKESVCDSL